MSQTFESSFVREFLKIRSSLTALALACLICPCAGAGDESKKTQTAQPETGRQMNWQKPTYGTSESSQETTCTVQGKPATKQQYEAVKVYDEGLLLMRSNANEEALQKFKQSISMYDGYAQVHHSLGLCYGKLGNTQEAIKELQKATEQNAQLNESWLLLAGFYQSTNLLQESVRTYHEYLRRFPGSSLVPKINVTLGLLYAKLGKNAEAINELTHSIELNPNLPASWITLGGVYQAKGDLKNALDTYCQFKERFPNDPMLPKINSLINGLTKEKNRQEKDLQASSRGQERETGEPDQATTRTAPTNSYSGEESKEAHNHAGRQKAQDNYLSALGEKLTRWPSSDMPVAVFISPSTHIKGYRDPFKNILIHSFNDWAGASGGKVSFILVDTPEKAKLKCFWTDNISFLKNQSEAGEAKLFQDGDYISRAEIWFLTLPLSKSMPLTDNMFRFVSLHEIGHALGLSGHTSNPDDIMFFSTTFKDSWAELSRRDAQSIRKLYESNL